MIFLPPATKFGQGYIFTGICHSVNRGAGGLFTGGVVSQHALRQTLPQSRHPPRAETPPDKTPPRQDTPPPRAEHAARYGQRTGGTHPTGMQTCVHRYFQQSIIQATSFAN